MSHNSKVLSTRNVPMQHDEKDDDKTRKRDPSPSEELAIGKEMESIAVPSDSKRMKVDTQPAAESQSDVSTPQELTQSETQVFRFSKGDNQQATSQSLVSVLYSRAMAVSQY